MSGQERDVERLAHEFMAPTHAPMSDHDPTTGACSSCPWPLHMVEGPEGLARAILASGWLAERDARIKAEAWDEGWRAAWSPLSMHSLSDGPNPYRADRIGGDR